MDRPTLAAHVLRFLALAQKADRVVTLATLTRALGVRRTDVRAVVTSLHREGFVDALRMRPTLAGYALGRAFARERLAALRRPEAASSVALVA